MNFDNITNQIYIVAINEAKLQGHEYITPEHFLYAMLLFDIGKEILEQSGIDINQLNEDLNIYFENNIYKTENCEPIESFELMNLINSAHDSAINLNRNSISLYEIINELFNLKESYCVYLLSKNGADKEKLLKYIQERETFENNKKVLVSEKDKDKDFLKNYTVDLTELAQKGELDPLIGRENVLERTIQTLSRRLKNNPVHVGEPGVGKTAIVEGLSQMIINENVPKALKDSKIYYLDMGSIIAGTKYRGDFEERLIKILDIIIKEKNPIIYIDEIHTIIGAGSVSGSSMDATSILKPYLLKSNLKIIGSTTYTEYKKYFEKDRALIRRFQKIDVAEPSVEECIKILNGIKHKYESFHNVIYTEKAIIKTCELSNKYLHERHLPDKAIDILDESGAYEKIKSSLNDNDSVITIDEEKIEHIVSQIARIPIEKVSSNETQKLKNLEINLKNEIFGQDSAVLSVVNAIKASRCGLNDDEKPVASLLFVGPTGVGKTELSRQLSNILGIKLKRFDMSEYQEKHSVARLIGSPPGYVGYEEGGLLTETINKNPYCVLLLDEIEKAHPDIYNILLQIMDYGKLTDNIGKHSDFRNVILIMTSNAGAKDMVKHIIGFDDKTANEDAVKKEIERIFSPEFRNRLDDVVLFNHISEEMAVKIAKKSINNLERKLSKKDIKIDVSEEAYKYIAYKGNFKLYGAREINRVIEKEIKKQLIDEILFGKLVNGGKVTVELKNDLISLKIRKKTRSNSIN